MHLQNDAIDVLQTDTMHKARLRYTRSEPQLEPAIDVSDRMKCESKRYLPSFAGLLKCED